MQSKHVPATHDWLFFCLFFFLIKTVYLLFLRIPSICGPVDGECTFLSLLNCSLSSVVPFSVRTHHHVPSKEASLQSAFSMQQRHLPAARCTAAAEQRRRCRRWRRRSAAVCRHPQFVLCQLDPSRNLNFLSKDETQKQKMMRKIRGGNGESNYKTFWSDK